MPVSKMQYDSTSAADTIVGFDFQYYYFLYRLITLQKGECIGLEIKDDVHINNNDGIQEYIQLKHTTQTKVNGTTINLTARGQDLWKTLSNWSKMIDGNSIGKGNIDEQIKFVEKARFILVTNKSTNDNNSILSAISEYKNNLKEIDKFRKILDKVKKDTKDKEIITFIENVLKLHNSVLEKFIENIQVNLGVDDMIIKCKDAIKEKMVKETRIEDVFRNIDSKIREDNYFSIKSGIDIKISFDEFYNKYRQYFDITRNDHLPIREIDFVLERNLMDQIFIQQLIDIEDISSEDIESITEYTRYKLKMINNVQEWTKNGEITTKEINDFEKDVILQWKNEFISKYRNKTKKIEVKNKATEILDKMREKKLNISEQPLDTELSNGEFYCLSDIPKIGWIQNWKEKFGNDKK